MSKRISPEEAKRAAEGATEVAFLDVRESGQFGEGHPLLAVPCPYSSLELKITALVPRRTVPVILIDAGDGVADKAAQRLEALSYTDVRVVSGGAPAWAATGFTLFKGVNVPSKTLGELAEETWHPAMVGAEELRAWITAGKPFRFFDARPPGEHAKMRVPGSRCLPNGELLYRFDRVVDDPDVPVLVTCAGRTRGIVGSVGLQLAGIPNPVFALENGTQGWALAGETLERGNDPAAFPPVGPSEKRAGEDRARRFTERFDIGWIDLAELEKLRRDPMRTLYLLDVRSEEEFAGGHLPGAVHAPSGQVVQATDQWVGVRRARVVLTDDNGARASLAAFWLKQLGYEVFVLAASGPPSEAGQSDGDTATPPDPIPEVDEVNAREAFRRVREGAVLIDLRSSTAHRAAAPQEAVWSIRPRLAHSPAWGAQSVVMLADDAGTAALAAVDLRESGVGDLCRLDATADALSAAGFSVASRSAPKADEAIDFLQFVHDRHDGNLDSSRRYLAWEKGLVAQLDAGERATFSLGSC